MSDHEHPSHAPGTEPNEAPAEHAHGHGHKKRARFSIAAFAKRPRQAEHRAESEEHKSARKGIPLPFSSETRVGVATVLSFGILMAALFTYYRGGGGKPEKPEKPGPPKLALASKDATGGAGAKKSLDDDNREAPGESGTGAGRVDKDKAGDDPFAEVKSPPPLPRGDSPKEPGSQGADPNAADSPRSTPPPRPRATRATAEEVDRGTPPLVPPRPPASGAGVAVDDTPSGERDGIVVSPPRVAAVPPRSNAPRNGLPDPAARVRSSDRDAAAPTPGLDAVPGEPEPLVVPKDRNAFPARPDARPRATAPTSSAEPNTNRGSALAPEPPQKPVSDTSLELSSRVPTPTDTTIPADWVPVPNLGKVRRSEDGATSRSPSLVPATKSTARPSSASMPGSQVHTVRDGETFFTISQTYYGSGRYYRALWAANRRQAPSLREPLIVGMSISVPPFEELDKALIERPSTSAAGAGGVIRSTPLPRGDDGASLASGATSGGLMLPVGRPSSGIDPITSDDLAALPQRKPSSNYPTYVVKKGDTYRSIARDLLGTNERADEIRQLNLDAISDSPRPDAGQQLRLPMDARLPQDTRMR